MEQRVDDLLGRMTLAEKAGMLLQTMIVVGSADLAEPNSRSGSRAPSTYIREITSNTT